MMDKMDGFKKALVALGSIFVAVALPTLIFLAKGNDVAAAVTGTFTVAIILSITHVAAFWAGAQYTKGAMGMGATIALKSQEINDKWDQTKMTTFGKLMQEGARIGRQNAGGETVPALPLPSQGLDWLPSVASYDVSVDADEEWRR